VPPGNLFAPSTPASFSCFAAAFARRYLIADARVSLADPIRKGAENWYSARRFRNLFHGQTQAIL
jgi:hypothetical protein